MNAVPRRIGDNSQRAVNEPEFINEGELRPKLHKFKALFRRVEQDIKDASDTMLEEKRYFKAQSAEAFEAIEAIRVSAIERMQSKLRERADYQSAEAAKKEAQEARKELVKEMKAEGVDVQALKQVLKLEKLDVFERKELFDKWDIYAKCLGMWEGGDDI